MAQDGDHEVPWLAALAELLIVRHLNVSIPDDQMRRQLLAEKEPRLWTQSERKFRCIAVVGAGASAPVLARGDDLATGLIEKFDIGKAVVDAERERLERITAVDPSEFEAQLSAIGQTLGNSRRVRAAISELYRLRHPTILAYELLAHLLKHRFIDAIISMNFDELLDQSLDDEVGVGEYERIVSDRDCVHAHSDVFAPDYVPLYIKLHGTASEPESLRYTRESYYDSPVQVGTQAARLFQVPECVVLNLGFGMTSFDLHRLLAIPDTLRLYNLSREPLSQKARKAIKRERRHQRKGVQGIFLESPRNEEVRKVEKQRRRERKKLRREEEQAGRVADPERWQLPSLIHPPAQDSDAMMSALLTRIEEGAPGLAKATPTAIALRPVERHRAVVGLLGPTSLPGRRLIKLPRGSEDPGLSLNPITRAARANSVQAGYLLRRTILELAFAMARGHGLVSIATLAVDRCGLYYDAYRRLAGRDPESWRALYRRVGFEQNEKVPDVVEATSEILEADASVEETLKDVLLDENGQREEWHALPRIDIAKLVDRVLPQIVDRPSEKDRQLLSKELHELYDQGVEYEIHSREDRVCAKTFTEPITLKTLTAMDAQSFGLLTTAGRHDGQMSIDIIAETGDWLRKRSSEAIKNLAAEKRIRLIVAFLVDVPDILREFPGIQVSYQQPWHHNRHMVILTKNGIPQQAIYFARHHRTPYVTPVLVNRRFDIDLLQTAFNNRWENADLMTTEDKISFATAQSRGAT